jgi:hypothetical protein
MQSQWMISLENPNSFFGRMVLRLVTSLVFQNSDSSVPHDHSIYVVLGGSTRWATFTPYQDISYPWVASQFPHVPLANVC